MVQYSYNSIRILCSDKMIKEEKKEEKAPEFLELQEGLIKQQEGLTKQQREMSKTVSEIARYEVEKLATSYQVQTDLLEGINKKLEKQESRTRSNFRLGIVIVIISLLILVVIILQYLGIQLI